MLLPYFPHNIFAWPPDTNEFGLKGIKDFILEISGAFEFVIFEGKKVSLLKCKLITRRHLDVADLLAPEILLRREELVTDVTVEHVHLLKILVMVLVWSILRIL